MRKNHLIPAMLILVLMAILGPGNGRDMQEECTVTVQPGESIQEAIDAAQAGDVLCLAAGTWEENLKITKSLTLRGRGAEQTVLDGVRENYPVVWIAASRATAQTISVKLERLRLTGAEGWDCTDRAEGICTAGVLVQGRARVEITKAAISHNGTDPSGYGLLITGPAKITISRSTVVGNPTVLELRDTARLELLNFTAGGGRFGIELRDAAVARVSDATVSGVYWSAIWAGDRAKLQVTRSTIARNGGGIAIADSARAEVGESIIEDNAGCGIAAWGSGKVEGWGNQMADNGADLCGNLTGGLRLPLAEPTEEEIVYPDERYGSLQEAVDALRPGGRLILQAGEYTPGAAIAKELTLEAAPGAHVVLVGNPVTWRNAPPVLSLISGARLHLRGVEVKWGNPGLLLAADAQAVIEGCAITWNWWMGIIASDKARLKIEASSISDNGDGRGILLDGSTWAEIIHSTISGNGMEGLVIRDNAEVEFIENKITDNSVGVELYEACRAEGDGGESAEQVRARVKGCGNLIPGPGEPEGNQGKDVCPESLRFLEEPCVESD